jgi:hypothetical protein
MTLVDFSVASGGCMQSAWVCGVDSIKIVKAVKNLSVSALTLALELTCIVSCSICIACSEVCATASKHCHSAFWNTFVSHSQSAAGHAVGLVFKVEAVDPRHADNMNRNCWNGTILCKTMLWNPACFPVVVWSRHSDVVIIHFFLEQCAALAGMAVIKRHI